MRVEVIGVIRWKQRNLTSNECNVSSNAMRFFLRQSFKYDKDKKLTMARVKKSETKLIIILYEV